MVPLNALTTLTNWTEVSDSGGSFDPVAGVYTAPQTGTYKIDLVVNYSTTAAITAQLGGGSAPRFEFVNSTSGSVILASNVPAINVSIALLLTLNTIIGRGQSVIDACAELTVGQQHIVRYNPGGATIGTSVNLSNPPVVTTLWIRRIA